MTPLFLAINYHYIGSRDRYPYPGIIGVTAEEFAHQLDVLSRDFTFVSQADVTAAVQNRSPLPERAIAITFDDGLREQFDVALPIMERKGVPFIFFVPSLPYTSGKACTVHKVHYLRSIVPPDEFARLVDDAAGRLFGDDQPLSGLAGKVPENFYPYDDKHARIIKYYLNFHLEPADTDQLVDAIFPKVADELEFCHRFYLDREQLREVHHRHGGLGLHCHSHRKLTDLTDREAAHEIGFCKETLENVVGAPLVSLSYPYGYRQAVSRREEEICRRLGLAFCFTMEPCFNRDVAAAPHLLGRINNNEAPGHPAAAFSVESGTMHIHDARRMNLCRTYYHQE